ncbi:MAG: magnesium transporter [Mariprofundaceae bacterium]
MAKDKGKEPTQLSYQSALEMAALQPVALRAIFANMFRVDIANLLLNCRDDAQRLELLALIPDDVVGATLLELPDGMQEDLLASFSPNTIEKFVDHLSSDDATDILQTIDKHVASEVIERLEPDERREIEPLLAHDEESAGGLMQVELFKVRDTWSIEKVLEVLRRWGREIENLNYVYIVNEDDHLTATVSLHTLLFYSPDTPILDVASTTFPFAIAGQDQEEVAHIFDKYDVLTLPVVDSQGILVGRITADDILDVVQEEATEDMYRLAALSDQDDLAEPIGITAWRRSIWLTVNLGTAILASFVISYFEDSIEKIVALAILMPIVASMGGIAGTQTLTVIVRGIALGRITFFNARRALLKEISVSVVTGSSFALLIGVITSFWFPEFGLKLGGIIAAAMMINIFAAGCAGALIPLTLQRINIDPALASGTILTTVTDVVGFFVFLGLATFFLL